MKKLTYVFGAALGGIAVCLVMTIVTAVREHRPQVQPQQISIPMPAMGK